MERDILYPLSDLAGEQVPFVKGTFCTPEVDGMAESDYGVAGDAGAHADEGEGPEDPMGEAGEAVADPCNLRLTALLHQLARQRGHKGAAKALGIDRRTVAAGVREGLSRCVRDALERELVEKDGDAGTSWRRASRSSGSGAMRGRGNSVTGCRRSGPGGGARAPAGRRNAAFGGPASPGGGCGPGTRGAGRE